MIGRIIWWTSLAATALLTAGLQLDFRTRSTPDLAPRVPEILRNYAQVRMTQSALAGDDPQKALAEAKRLVERRPLPAEYLALLAASQAKAGQDAAAGQTIQIAGQRGWREPVTQEAVLRIALAAGDRAEAARRYVALFLRNQTPDALLEQLGTPVLAGPDDAGRKAMVTVVVGAERWRTTFLRRGARVMPPAAFSDIAVASIRAGVTFDCKTLGLSLKELARRDAAAAQGLALAASAQCPDAAPKTP